MSQYEPQHSTETVTTEQRIAYLRDRGVQRATRHIKRGRRVTACELLMQSVERQARELGIDVTLPREAA